MFEILFFRLEIVLFINYFEGAEFLFQYLEMEMIPHFKELTKKILEIPGQKHWPRVLAQQLPLPQHWKHMMAYFNTWHQDKSAWMTSCRIPV